jgi:hypothetical protein
VRTIVLDYETFYCSKTYTLRKMSPAEYILDPRFEVIGCSIIDVPNLSELQDAKPVFLDGPQFAQWTRQVDWSQVHAICYNGLFDFCILGWWYGAVPALMIDAMGMARALLGHKLKSMSLDSVSHHLNLRHTKTLMPSVDGLNTEGIKRAGLWNPYVQYANNDTETCRDVFLALRPEFPPREYIVKDMVLRCAVEPQFIADRVTLAQHLHDIKNNKTVLLTKCMLLAGCGVDQLRSDKKFAEVLEKMGIKPGMKISKITQNPAYAFAKTDFFMQSLLEHPRQDVQTLAAARLGIKSTIEETRTERLLAIANLKWPAAMIRTSEMKARHTRAILTNSEERFLPVPLRYAAAHTHRLGGDWKLNFQNLPRGGAIRKCLLPLPGRKVITGDQAQIEARLVAWFCDEQEVLQQFRDGLDVYSILASDIYGRQIHKDRDKSERFVGKQARLGLGFGMGAHKFFNMVQSLGNQQNVDVSMFVPALAAKAVDVFRGKNWRTKDMWRTLNDMLTNMAYGQGNFFPIKSVQFEQGAIKLPNDLKIYYDNLRVEGDQWMYDYAGEKRQVFGGKVLENIIQALARIIVMDAALEIRKHLTKLGLWLAMQVHDELVYTAPDELVEQVKSIIYEEMIRPPSWAPDLPLAVEIGVGPSFGEAK